MPRYFFSVRHRPGPKGLALDEEGDVLPDLNAAREHALFMARDMIARQRLSLIRDWFACSFAITNEQAERVLIVPFNDTVPDLNDS